MNPRTVANAHRYAPLMNRIKFIVVLIITTLPTGLYSQVQNLKFEESKGKWSSPIPKYSQVLDLNKTLDHVSALSTIFITDSAYEVKSVYEGTVIAVECISENCYFLLTKFGDYYLVYINLTKPNLRKGDHIKRGVIIGSIQKEAEEREYKLELILMKSSIYIPIFDWFNFQSGA